MWYRCDPYEKMFEKICLGFSLMVDSWRSNCVRLLFCFYGVFFFLLFFFWGLVRFTALIVYNLCGNVHRLIQVRFNFCQFSAETEPSELWAVELSWNVQLIVAHLQVWALNWSTEIVGCRLLKSWIGSFGVGWTFELIGMKLWKKN